MTRKLYYQNPYQFEFSARVLSCQAFADHYAVLLDQTCFYPEGGGQPADQGWLNEVPVFDVQIREGQIYHYTPPSLPTGPVTGKIDRRRRYDFMQQHTGQHIFSRSLLQVGGYQTVSVHFGDTYTAVEIATASIPEEQLHRIEELANRIVLENRPVKTYWVEPAQASELGLRKEPGAFDTIRVVEIADFDKSACGGTHVNSTGEVGWIKIVQLEKIRGHLRIHLKIGQRAREDYERKNKLIRELNRLLTCGEEDLVERVRYLSEEVRRNQTQIKKLQTELMQLRAREAVTRAVRLGEGYLVSAVFEDVAPAALKAFVQEVLRNPGFIVVAINKNASALNWVIGHSWASALDLKSIVDPLLSLLEGKGGGKGHLLQGGGQNPAGIEQFVGKLKEKLQQEIGA